MRDGRRTICRRRSTPGRWRGGLRAPQRGWVASLAVAMAAGCGSAPDGREPGATALGDVVVWGETITLEENEDVINVHPRVRADGPSGYLVADMGEYQVRGYDARGRLRFHYGSQGPGPRQFSVPPMGVLREGDGSLLVGDFSGRIARLDATAREERAVMRTPLQVLYHLEPLPGDSVILVVGRHRDAPHALLHLFDPAAGTVRRSFFPTPLDPALDQEVFFVTHADARVRNGVIAAAFALDSVVRLFDVDGTPRGAVTLPTSRFRPLRTGLPGSADDLMTWLETFSRLSDVFWLDDESLLVQYYDMDGLIPVWSVVGVTLEGRKLFEVTSSPRLLASGRRDGEALFVHPEAEAPDTWVVARFTASSR